MAYEVAQPGSERSSETGSEPSGRWIVASQHGRLVTGCEIGDGCFAISGGEQSQACEDRRLDARRELPPIAPGGPTATQLISSRTGVLLP